jgi:hypothetical protein
MPRKPDLSLSMSATGRAGLRWLVRHVRPRPLGVASAVFALLFCWPELVGAQQCAPPCGPTTVSCTAAPGDGSMPSAPASIHLLKDGLMECFGQTSRAALATQCVLTKPGNYTANFGVTNEFYFPRNDVLAATCSVAAT